MHLIVASQVKIAAYINLFNSCDQMAGDETEYDFTTACVSGLFLIQPPWEDYKKLAPEKPKGNRDPVVCVVVCVVLWFVLCCIPGKVAF